MSETALQRDSDRRAWWRHLNGYHWYVFALAALGWLFDTMDGQIFLASRSITIRDLLPDKTDDVRREYGGYVTSMFILGWATGGILFGMLGDRWGRAKTMALTILVYAGFTGLSAISRTWWEFGTYRFLTGMGVGGEFAAGAALVAEVMPEKARAKALGFLQALSAVGNMIGATLFWVVEPIWGWQGLYLLGAFPALLAVIVRLGLKEPDKWVAAQKAARESADAATHKMGRMRDLFNPHWRRNTLVGFALGVAGVLGLWGVGFFSPELMDSSFPEMSPETQVKVARILEQRTPESFAAAVSALKEDETSYVAFVSTAMQPPIPADAALKTPLTETQARQLADAVKADEAACVAFVSTAFQPPVPAEAALKTPLSDAQLKQLLDAQAAGKTGMKWSPETRQKLAAVSKATDAKRFAAAIAAFGKDDQAYQNLVSRRLKKADVVDKDRVFTTPLNEAQAAQASALLRKALAPEKMTALKAKGLLLQQVGAFIGIMMFSVVATRWGRRPAFLFSFLIAWFSVAFVFLTFDEHYEVWYLYPLLGFGTLAPFGGYALYFPELFPTRLRTTGTGFCYNTGRYVSALGPAALGYLGATLHGVTDIPGFRLAAAVVSSAYLIGILALIWAPETKDQALPDDEKIAAH